MLPKIRYGHNQEEPTYLYVLSCAKHTKVGIAADVADRVKHLQYANPLKIETLVQRLFLTRREARAAERIFHDKYGHCRTWGEWFDMDATEIAAEVSNMYIDATLPTKEPELSYVDRIASQAEENKRLAALQDAEDMAWAESARPLYARLAI